MMFTLMVSSLIILITVLGFFLSKEYFAQNVYKSARKKLLTVNLITLVLFICLYPNVLDLNMRQFLPV